MHSDVCGPMSISARDGSRYFVTFTDDFSRYGYVYLMRHKSESFKKIKEFKAEVENQLGKKIKVFITDRDGEYLSGEFRGYLKAHGILSQLTPPGTPQWNGVSERKNRTLLDMVCSMMSKAALSRFF
jgi:transposase InsO family protein